MQYTTRFGLVGNPLNNSFSVDYFTNKFKINFSAYQYRNYPIERIDSIIELVQKERLSGFNVTIPFKKAIIPYLTELSPEAEQIKSVNTVKIIGDRWIGFNTDIFGFKSSIKPLLNQTHTHALVLGTGGSAATVCYVLEQIGIKCLMVSRKEDLQSDKIIPYAALNRSLMEQHQLLVNCTPVGMFPNNQDCPVIPYEWINSSHLAFDLVYLPEKTVFLQKAEEQGACIKNGLEMLHKQADKAFEIFTC